MALYNLFNKTSCELLAHLQDLSLAISQLLPLGGFKAPKVAADKELRQN